MTDRHPTAALERMVVRQIEARGIHDRLVLDAFRAVDRADFVPQSQTAAAYEDRPVPIGEGQTISQPYMVARMTAELELHGGERVLEIGTGSGYQTAILARIAREVHTVEYVASLAEQARRTLEGLGYRNIHYRVGDGTLGWPEAGPFDRILAAAAAPDIPAPWIRQLADPGLALLPIGPSGGQRLLRLRLIGGRQVRDEFCPCSFVLMRGKYGFARNFD